MSTVTVRRRSLPSTRDVDAAVALLGAAAHRPRLLVLLALGREGPLHAGALGDLTGLEQSAASHQLRVLREAGLVRAERRGKQVVYELADAHVLRIVEDAVAHGREIDRER